MAKTIKIEKGKEAELKRYTKIILEVPKNITKLDIFNFKTREEAQIKANKLKSWPYYIITQARSENGKFAKGWALIVGK